MAKTIEFYIPQSFRKVSKWLPPKRHVVNCSGAPHVDCLENFYGIVRIALDRPYSGFPHQTVIPQISGRATILSRFSSRN